VEFRPRLLATGIGSLPHTDVSEALDLVFEAFPEAPHWPQLPKRCRAEGFSRQFLAPLMRLGLVSSEDGGRPFFDVDNDEWIPRITQFYETYLSAAKGERSALELFAFPPRIAPGFYGFIERMRARGGGARFVKGQVSGALSVGISTTDADLRAAYYHEDVRDVIVKAMACQARWQAAELSTLGLPVVIFVDEPALYACGASTFVTLDSDTIVEGMNEAFDAVAAEGAIPGTHVCSEADWSIPLCSRTGVLAFDAYKHLRSLPGYSTELRAFLDRGGALGWGIVPSSEEVRGESVESLAQRFEEGVDLLASKGIDRRLLLERALITPSCGATSVSQEDAVTIYRLTSGLSAELRRRHMDERGGGGSA